MRVLITTFSWPPHYYPLVPLGWGCRMAGHEVVVASMPTLTEAIVKSGLPAVSVGPHPDEAFAKANITFVPPKGSRGVKADAVEAWPADWPAHPETLSQTQRAYFTKVGLYASVMADAQVPELLDFAKDWKADIIVHDGAQFAAAPVASALGIPNARFLLGYPGQMRVDTGYSPDPVPEYTAIFDKYGIEPRIEPTAWIDPCPPSVQYPYAEADTVLPIRYVTYNGLGADQSWLRDTPTKARVVMTWGHTTAEWEGPAMLELVRRTIDAALSLDVELVAALSPTLHELLGELPPEVKSAVRVPMHTLLENASAVIHHSGPGTTMTSAATGVPQLMVTNHPHNESLAARIAATGSGRHLLLHEVPDTVEGIRTEIAALLEKPSYADSARWLQQEIAELPSPLEVAGQLGQLRDLV